MALRIATFNLKDFFSARKEGEKAVVEAKLSNVAESLRRARADVVALQEVGSLDLLDRLVKALPEQGYGAPVVGSEDRRGIRNVILSRLPVQWSQVHQAKALPFPRFVEGDPEPFAGRIPLRRGVVHVRVEAGGLGEVDVLTAHFKSNLPAELKTATGEPVADTTPHAVGESAVRSLVQRAAEALYVRGLVDGIFAHSPDHAICVLGDLNDTLDSLPVRLVRGIDTRSKLYLRAAVESIPEEARYSCFHGGEETLIDHVLVSERLHRALRHFEIHNENLRYHGPHVDDAPLTEDSDHALCLAELDDAC
ncbi:MAG: endonuclease/exonuclease/phosphatase family protein [Labilithrix sp.]|nr:endonuclease/exonuclease/phosphatase family protein [Labilithrix sp.]MCW5832151.1 endonuclease/exonuclease/phosphatase family protein [Labilithrix sp.]